MDYVAYTNAHIQMHYCVTSLLLICLVNDPIYLYYDEDYNITKLKTKISSIRVTVPSLCNFILNDM